jgi:putative (di)nucleoside polyphosphate hydrolase
VGGGKETDAAAALARLPWRPCVGVMLINPAGLIFAGQRIDSELPAWQMPQGGVDRGESPEDAALRELGEEIGIGPDRVALLDATPDWLRYDLPPAIVPRIWGGRYRGQEQRWFLMRFLGSDDEITLETKHPEFSAWRWIDAAALLDGIVPFKRPIYEQVIARFRPWLA